ncbi:MAG TPA: hypothetical protein VF590_21930 [Isosphaeraceae bacterium]|jgi:hypothetical protein
MTASTRAELLQVIADLARIDPKMRIGQLFCNLASLVEMTPEATWTVEDGALLAEAKDHLESQIRRLGVPSLHPSTDPTRVAILEAIRGCADRRPGVPLGRVVADLVTSSRGRMPVIDRAGVIWDIEDDDLLATVRSQAGPPSGPNVKTPDPLTRDSPLSSDHPAASNP